MSENIGDKFEVVAGSKFIKQWILRNDGEIAWPNDIVFEQSSGDYMESNPVLVKYAVLPNTDYTWEVELTAPSKIGRYTAYFRMRTNDGKKFGHKVWCDIQVVEGIKEEKVVISVN